MQRLPLTTAGCRWVNFTALQKILARERKVSTSFYFTQASKNSAGFFINQINPKYFFHHEFLSSLFYLFSYPVYPCRFQKWILAEIIEVPDFLIQKILFLKAKGKFFCITIHVDGLTKVKIKTRTS